MNGAYGLNLKKGISRSIKIKLKNQYPRCNRYFLNVPIYSSKHNYFDNTLTDTCWQTGVCDTTQTLLYIRGKKEVFCEVIEN